MPTNAPPAQRNHPALTCSAVRPKLARGGWRDMGQTQHFVQVYEHEETLIASLADYATEGLRHDERVLLILTADHAHAVNDRLREHGLDPMAAADSRRLHLLDAHATLTRLMIGGMPDPELFDITIASLVRQAGRHGHHVRAYGEMVALLSAAGNSRAALRLEEMWNTLRTQARFSLFCGYPAACFHGDQGDDLLAEVCLAHSRVIPMESFAA